MLWQIQPRLFANPIWEEDYLGDIEYQCQNLRQSSLTRGNHTSIAGICSKFRCTGESWVVLATGPGNPPAVRVRTGKTVRFGSRTIQKPDPQRLGEPNPDPYPSTPGFCRGLLDPSVPISGSVFRVFLFMVAFRYPTVSRKILTFAHH